MFRGQVCFWLTENGLRVLVAACDTFRAGAVEQLRTHVRKLNALHRSRQTDVQDTPVGLYEKGYGKDAAGIAMEAIGYGMVGNLSTLTPLHSPHCVYLSFV